MPETSNLQKCDVVNFACSTVFTKRCTSDSANCTGYVASKPKRNNRYIKAIGRLIMAYPGISTGYVTSKPKRNNRYIKAIGRLIMVYPGIGIEYSQHAILFLARN